MVAFASDRRLADSTDTLFERLPYCPALALDFFAGEADDGERSSRRWRRISQGDHYRPKSDRGTSEPRSDDGSAA